MPTAPLTIENLAAMLPPKGRLIGVDLGAKTIGLSLSDVERRLASPLKTIARTRFTADARLLLGEAEEHACFALVIGLPLALDGGDTPRSQSTRAFVRNLRPLTTLPCAFWDERFSTAAVERDLIGHDVSRARRAEVIDKMAAAYILQGALDRLTSLAQPGLR